MFLNFSIQEPDFCLDLSRNGNLIAAPTSKNSIKIFDSNSLHLTTTLNARSLAINAPGSKRDPGSIKAVEWLDEQTIIAGLDSSDGAIAAFDIRTGQIVDRPVLSLTMNKEKTLLCAGTELFDYNALMMFYDLRNASTPIQKWAIHSDDVTQVKFNPYHSNVLISGSTDGTTNIYDISVLDEDESLQFTLPEGSIYKLGYFGPKMEYVYSLTHIETFALHRFHDAELVASYGDVRRSVALSIECAQIEYALDCQYLDSTQELYLLAGDRNGRVSLLNVDLDGLAVSSSTVKSQGGHTSTVRGARLNAEDNSMISCAEDGTLCLWKK